MENERMRITLDNPEKIYFAGQTIKGDLLMIVTKRTKIRGVKIQITGKGKCKWMEILRKNSNNESMRSLFYSSKEIYAHFESPISVFEPRGLELSPGEHSFQFQVPLDWNLPSSFKGSYGSIKYKMRVLIHRPWSFDERHTVALTVVKNMPLSPCFHDNPTSLEKQVTKTISLFGTRPITLLALLPADFVVRGKSLRICATVTNNSTTNVEKLRFSVLQNICYYSHVPLRIQKMECVAIISKETGSVHKKSERSFAHELLIPESIQPTDDELSGVINITYEMRVEAVLRGFFKNLILNLPFKIYSNEPQACGITPITQSINSGEEVTGSISNPFQQLAGYPMYPTLTSSIGSPSHSSHLSESSSMHSTTSDSSAATLSPAVAGMELSYASGSSSQFNSPSARESMRSSNVPYTAYSSSPHMVASYPPPHLPPYEFPESPQYTLLPQARNTPTHSHHQPSSSVSFLSDRHYSATHELPPSYEELFGNATALQDPSK